MFELLKPLSNMTFCKSVLVIAVSATPYLLKGPLLPPLLPCRLAVSLCCPFSVFWNSSPELTKAAFTQEGDPTSCNLHLLPSSPSEVCALVPKTSLRPLLSPRPLPLLWSVMFKIPKLSSKQILLPRYGLAPLWSLR